MPILKTIFLTLAVIILTTGVSVAQTSVSTNNPTSANTPKNEADFVSVEGGFTIALPARITSYGPNERVEAIIVGGSKYTWNIPQGFFMVSFYQYASVPENPKSLLERIGGTLIDDMKSDGGTLISKKEIAIDGNKGLEIRMRLKKGTIGIARYYSVKNLTFFLSSGWNETDNGETQLKILDSFKLIDGKAIIDKKLQEAMPKPLPQSPTVEKLTTDAQDDELKGKVKSVVETKEDLTGTWSVSGIKKSTEDYYDDKGNKIKRIFYDYKGNPNDITVYGFIDGMRVSNSGSLNFEYNPPIMAMRSFNTKPNPVVKPADTRYETRYEYKYDDKKRLSESLSYRNNGEMIRKNIYSYDGNKLEDSWFDKEGKLIVKTIKLFDDKANLIETIYGHQTPDYPDSKYNYTYQSFDEKGNWTKRTISAKDGVYGGGYKQQNYIEYRTITYYP